MSVHRSAVSPSRYLWAAHRECQAWSPNGWKYFFETIGYNEMRQKHLGSKQKAGFWQKVSYLSWKKTVEATGFWLWNWFWRHLHTGFGSCFSASPAILLNKSLFKKCDTFRTFYQVSSKCWEPCFELYSHLIVRKMLLGLSSYSNFLTRLKIEIYYALFRYSCQAFLPVPTGSFGGRFHQTIYTDLRRKQRNELRSRQCKAIWVSCWFTYSALSVLIVFL